MSHWLMRLVCCLIVFELGGCTNVIQPELHKPQITSTNKLSEGYGWWYARFQINWPENTDPHWFMGALLAGEVVSPLLKQYQEDIELWRFHRRAGRNGGHLFSFIFYSSPQLAQQIYRAIDTNLVVIRLKQEQQIVTVIFDDLKIINRPGIADTSDKNWADPVQRAWPHFIMGASQMWLSLINELVGQRNRDQDIQTLYREVQDQITDIWAQQGQHAWLHHLSALYAYQPLMIRY